MAVVVKYVVVRNGEEKMTFATKKEADAHDRMLDIAENLYDFIGQSDDSLNLDDTQRELLSLYLARNSDQVMNILRGIPVKQSSPSPGAGEGAESERAGGGEGRNLESAPTAEKRRGGKSKISKEPTIEIG